MQFATIPIALLFALGCGKSYELAPITGSVTYKGQPLKFGTVLFQPMTGGQPAQGDIQPDGTFVMETYQGGEGARLGQNQVSVHCYESQDPNRAAAKKGTEQSLGKLLIPGRYTMFNTSGLAAEVKPEGNEPIVFELKDM